MEPIEFWKMNGSGNDFILIDNRSGKIKDEEMGRLVQRACRRRESVGADGVIFVTSSKRYDFAWHYLNADGGEVEMCGNGGRCVARFAFLKGIADQEMTFETLVGPVSAKVDGRMVKVLMPKPTGLQLDVDLGPQQGWRNADFVNTGVPHVVVHGVPHVVVHVEDLVNHPVTEEGRAIRHHAHFTPEGTNANFMKPIGPDQLEVRTYERGVEDETLACGTGAIACSLVASARGMVRSPVEVRTRGGESLIIHFQKKGARFDAVWLQGSTSIVYQGQLHEEAL
jgi:diaminopimelate epimerase